ncbi:hypothetical protein GGF42_004996 [Coemansia sp. RSA 2424]|nr:hypothetical protein GGF42_004996 [Coemansia sp. RSA 2424]
MDTAKDSTPAAEEQVTSEVSPPPAAADSSTSSNSEAKPKPTPMSLKQIYGMLCWLQVGDNSKRWQEEPLEACKQAVSECPHLVDTDAEQLCAQMDSVNEQRKQKIAEFGDAASVPQEARVFPGGPLFAIVDYALSGHCASALVEAHGTGRPADAVAESSASGPIRNSQQQHHQSKRPGPYSSASSSVMERARRLTPAEIQQMRDELAIRREIAMRDAVLLADWTALKRRELEIKELKLRELIRSNRSSGYSIEGLLQFEEYVNGVLRDGV